MGHGRRSPTLGFAAARAHVLTHANVERAEPIQVETGTPVDKLVHVATLMRQIAVAP